MRLALLLTFSLMAGTAYADFYDGNKLYAMCQSDNPTVTGVVSGYVAGWIDKQEWDTSIIVTAGINRPYQDDLAPSERSISYRACVPANATVQQTKDLVCKYLKEHPESRHYNATNLVGDALHDSWPCHK